MIIAIFLGKMAILALAPARLPLGSFLALARKVLGTLSPNPYQGLCPWTLPGGTF